MSVKDVLKEYCGTKYYNRQVAVGRIYSDYLEGLWNSLFRQLNVSINPTKLIMNTETKVTPYRDPYSDAWHDHYQYGISLAATSIGVVYSGRLLNMLQPYLRAEEAPYKISLAFGSCGYSEAERLHNPTKVYYSQPGVHYSAIYLDIDKNDLEILGIEMFDDSVGYKDVWPKDDESIEEAIKYVEDTIGASYCL